LVFLSKGINVNFFFIFLCTFLDFSDKYCVNISPNIGCRDYYYYYFPFSFWEVDRLAQTHVYFVSGREKLKKKHPNKQSSFTIGHVLRQTKPNGSDKNLTAHISWSIGCIGGKWLVWGKGAPVCRRNGDVSTVTHTHIHTRARTQTHLHTHTRRLLHSNLRHSFVFLFRISWQGN